MLAVAGRREMGSVKNSIWHGLKLGLWAAAATTVVGMAVLPINPRYVPLFAAGFACLGFVVGTVVGFVSKLVGGEEAVSER